MVASPQPQLPIRESRIVHLSTILHPLARFVTEETAAMLFGIQPEDIYRIRCMRHVVHVHGRGVSRFVSYADFPPITRVNLPTAADFPYWRKRWYKSHHKHQAPDFWKQFYTLQFICAASMTELLEWENLLESLKSAFSAAVLQQLQDACQQQKHSCNH